MDLLAHLRTLRRRWRIPLVGVVLGMVLGASTTMLEGEDPTYYRATTTLAGDSSVNLAQAAALTTTGPVPERVGEILGVPGSGLRGQVTARPEEAAQILTIDAVGVDPERTRLTADTFADELVTYLDEFTATGRADQIAALERRIAPLEEDLAALVAAAPLVADPTERALVDADIASLRAELRSAESELANLRSSSQATAGLQVVTPAEPVPISGPQFRELFGASADADDQPDPEAALSPSRDLGLAPRIAMGGILGLALGVAAVFVLDRFDPRLRTKEEAESTFGWPVLVEVPTLTKAQQRERTILAHDAPRSRGAEAYRGLRSSVLFALRSTGSPELVPTLPANPAAPGSEGTGEAGEDDRPSPSGRVVLITSPSPTEGKTTTSSNLATVLGEAGFRVLVMNCDFRRPSLGRYLGVADDAAQVVPTDVDGVHLLAQVSEDQSLNPAEVIATQRAAIEEARKRFDVVVLDTAPLLTTNDATEILDAADLVVVVARSGRTTREAADRAAELLERRNAAVLGVVLLAADDAPIARSYYYGDYYLDDEAGRGDGRADAAARPEPAPGAGVHAEG